MRLPSVTKRRVLWTCTLAALAGLGWVLYHFLPPEPRWRSPTGDDGLSPQLLPGRDKVLTSGAADGKIEWVLRDVWSGEPLRAYFRDSHPDPDHKLYTSKDGRWAVIFDLASRRLRWANLEDGHQQSLHLRDELSIAIELSPKDPLAVVRLVTPDYAPLGFALIDLNDGTIIFREDLQVDRVSFSNCGKALVVEHRQDEKPAVKVLDVSKRRWIFDRAHTRCVGYSRFKYACQSLLVVWFEPPGQPTRCEFVDLNDGTAFAPLPEDAQLRDASYSPQGTRCLVVYHSAQRRGQQIEVWDLALRRTLLQTSQDKFDRVAFSPSGTFLVVADQMISFEQGARLFEVETGQELWSLPSLWFSRKRVSPAFAPDEKTFLSFDHSNLVLREARTGKVVCSIRANLNARAEPPWHPEGQRPIIQTDFVNHPILRLLDWFPRPHRPNILSVDFARERLIRFDWLQEHERVECLPQELDLVFTIQPGSNGPPILTCWDLHPHGPWRWVLGIPAGVGILIAAAVWLIGRRTRKFGDKA